jgi:hypothetical protein
MSMDKFGVTTAQPAATAQTAATSLATPSAAGAQQVKLISPANPLFVFAVLLAVTGGFAAFGTSARVGPVAGKLEVGKS